MLLRHARKKAGLTQEELNQRLGKYKSFVSKYESGERRLDVMEFIDIAEALDLDAASVLKAVMSGGA